MVLGEYLIGFMPLCLCICGGLVVADGGVG